MNEILNLPRRQQVVYRLLHEAAENGLPCPTNHQISEALGEGLSSIGTDIIGRLATLGLIKFKKGGNVRLVTICATGKSTKTTTKRARRDKRIEPRAGLCSEQGPAIFEVSRDTCFWCGCRGDVCQCKLGKGRR